MDDIKIRRIGCAGHVIRMEDIRAQKRKFLNTRPIGKPRTKWENVVWRETSQILGMRGWRRRAEDREEWRRLQREDGAQKGL